MGDIILNCLVLYLHVKIKQSFHMKKGQRKHQVNVTSSRNCLMETPIINLNNVSQTIHLQIMSNYRNMKYIH